MPPSHECPAPRCEVWVPDNQLACKQHWFALPKELRARIWNHYVPGQTAATMTADYAAALSDCLRVWKAKR